VKSIRDGISPNVKSMLGSVLDVRGCRGTQIKLLKAGKRGDADRKEDNKGRLGR
jgi:hypothetical protein